MIPINQLIIARGGAGGLLKMMKLLRSPMISSRQLLGGGPSRSYAIYSPPPTSATYQPIAVRIGGPGGSGQGGAGEGYPPRYSELPLPDGEWQKVHDENNARYNKHLILGISFLVLTIFCVSRVPNVVFMFSPPPLEGEEGEDCQVAVDIKKCAK